MKVLVVVASATGRTYRVAEAVAEGAREAGAEVLLRQADDATGDHLLGADAIVLGSGVHMSGVESSMRAFLERTSPLWLQGRLIGKIGAAFAAAGEGERGGTEHTLVSLLAALAEHGLLLVSMPNRLPGFRRAGSHWGPLVRTHPSPQGEGPGPVEEDLRAARAHGRYVAECTQRWLRGAERA